MAPMACLAGDGWLRTGEDAPPNSKALMTALPRGGYTACRTVGGVCPGGARSRVLLLEFHLDRLCSSLRILYPDLDFDALPLPTGDAGEGGAPPPHGLVDAPGTADDDVLLVLYGGDASKGGRGASAAEQIAKQLQARVAGARIESLRGASPDILRVCTSCAVILECDAEGQPVFPAAKFLRSLKAPGAPSLDGISFSVLGLATSACEFSSASLGQDKFRAAAALSARLEELGGTQLAACGYSDVEVEDLEASVVPWMQEVCAAIQGSARSEKNFDAWLRGVSAVRMEAALRGMAVDDGNQEAMLIVVCYPDLRGDGSMSGVQVQALASPLHESLAPAIVQVGGRPRNLPLAKDTAWVNERIPFEEAKGPDVSEVILVDHQGEHLLEGLVTNFFVINDEGALVTAGDGVLKGHVRQLVISAARRAHIKVKLRAPALCDASTWKGAFLTSAARIVQPISKIRILPTSGGATGVTETCFEDLSAVAAMREMVMHMLLEAA